MADSTLNRFIASGTAAERAAFTPTPPTPASGPDQGYFFYETDTGDTYSWDGSAWQQINTGAGAGDLVSTNNLSDVANAATARTNLGLAIGTDVQAYDADLAALAAITPSQGDIIYHNGTSWVRLAAGTSGQVLKTNGAGADPSWTTPTASGWTLFSTTTISTPVASVEVTGLAGYTEIMIQLSGWTYSTTNAALLQVSTNNGSSYYSASGDYVVVSSAGALTNTVGGTFYTGNTTSARTGTIIIEGNVAGAPKNLKAMSDSYRQFIADNANDIDAIKILGVNAGNITAGTMTVLVK